MYETFDYGMYACMLTVEHACIKCTLLNSCSKHVQQNNVYIYLLAIALTTIVFIGLIPAIGGGSGAS